MNLPPHKAGRSRCDRHRFNNQFNNIGLMNAVIVSSSVNIWPALESTRGLTSVAACWRQRVGEQFEPFRTAFLQRAPGVPKGMPCPRGCACTHEIVVQREFPSPNPIGRGARGEGQLSTINSRPSTFTALCRCDPPNCPDIPLTAEDVVLFELSWNKIARALCHVFALDHKPADLGLLNTRQIGSWSVDAVPVILTIQHEPCWFRSVLLELIARLRRRFILLAPTAGNLDAVCVELLESANAGFFALDASLALTEPGTLRLTGARAPGELFAKFTPQPKDVDEDLATRAFALVRQLESDQPTKPPSALTVFRLYCIDQLTPAQIARKCRCDRSTVRRRLQLIESRTGTSPDRLRKVSAHLDKLEAGIADSRAAHIHRKSLIYDADDSADD